MNTSSIKEMPMAAHETDKALNRLEQQAHTDIQGAHQKLDMIFKKEEEQITETARKTHERQAGERAAFEREKYYQEAHLRAQQQQFRSALDNSQREEKARDGEAAAMVAMIKKRSEEEVSKRQAAMAKQQEMWASHQTSQAPPVYHQLALPYLSLKSPIESQESKSVQPAANPYSAYTPYVESPSFPTLNKLPDLPPLQAYPLHSAQLPVQGSSTTISPSNSAPPSLPPVPALPKLPPLPPLPPKS